MLVIYSKETNYDAKILDTESIYITTADYNTFTDDIVANKTQSAGLVNKYAIVKFINKADLNKI